MGLYNPADTIEAVNAHLPGCEELRQQIDALMAERQKASYDYLRLAAIRAKKLGIAWADARHYTCMSAT